MQLSATGTSAAVHAQAHEASDLSAARPYSFRSFPDQRSLRPARASAGHRVRNLLMEKLIRCDSNSWLHLLCALALLSFSVCWSFSAAAAPSATSELLAQARLAQEMGNYPRAIELYSSLLEDRSRSKEQRQDSLKGRAFAYGELKRFDEQEKDLSEAVQLYPNDTNNYIARGFFYLDRNRFDDALADFATGAKLSPRDEIFAYGKGRVFSARREFAAAIAQYTDAVRLSPSGSVYFLWRAEAYLQLKRYREALADYDQALKTGELIPRAKAQLHMGRGHLFLSTNDFAAAIRDFDKVLEFNSKSFLARKWRGIAYEEMGDRAQALADYQGALDLKGDDKELAERIARLRAR